VVGETRPLLAFHMMEGWWWPFMDETSTLLAFEAMEGVPVVAVDQNKRITPLLAFGAREGVVVVAVEKAKDRLMYYHCGKVYLWMRYFHMVGLNNFNFNFSSTKSLFLFYFLFFLIN
jgi:hypothetical protein